MSKTIAWAEGTFTNVTEPFTVMLTNEAQQFATDSNRKVTSAQSYYTDIIVIRGSQERTDYTIGNITSGSGITVSKNSKRVTFSVSAGATIGADTGVIEIPITLDGQTVKKQFSWSCGKQGPQGIQALQPTRNWTGTFTTIGGIATTTIHDFNRTPVVGDVFTNLDGSSNTGTWQVTKINGSVVEFKLLSYVNSKGQKGDAGEDGSNFAWNLVKGTGTAKEFTPEADKINQTVLFYTLDLSNQTLEAGDKFVVSCDFEWTQFTAGTGGTFNYWFQGAVDKSWFYNNIFTDGLKSVAPTVTEILASGGTRHLSAVCTMTQSLLDKKVYNLGIRFDYSDGTGKVKISNLKIAKEEKESPWCLHPDELKGATGDKGKSVTNIIEYYLATSASSGVTASTSGWSTDPTTQKLTAEKKYLWNCKQTVFDDGTKGSITNPVICGTYGDKGNDGQTSYVHTAYANITYLCGENHSFTLTEDTLVRYGTKGKWVYKTFSAGTYSATSSVFGSDPYVGLGKEADKITDFSTTDTTGRLYTGQYVDFSETASTDPSKYNWAKTTGDNGISPKVSLSKSGDTTTISIVDATGTHTQTVKDGTNGTPGAAGKDGKTSYFHVKYSNDGGKTFTENSGEDTGIYMGSYTDYTEADSTDVKKYTWVKVKGDKGTNGTNGTSVTVSKTEVTYQVSTSGTTAPTGTWSTTMPTCDQGQYLWTKTYVKYSDGKDTTSYAVSYKGVDGEKFAFNMLRGTNQGSKHWTNIGASGKYSVESITTDDNINAAKLICTEAIASNEWQFCIFRDYEMLKSLKALTTYVLSYDIKTNRSGTILHNIKTGGGQKVFFSNDISCKVLGNETWEHISITMTTSSTLPSLDGQVVYMFGNALSKVGYSIIKNLKLTEGTVDTPWAPHPEDLEGRGVSETVQYYLATNLSSGVTSSTSGWSTDITTQKITATKKYLWNCYQTKYSDGTNEPISTPKVIGVYGDKGQKGDNAKNLSITPSSQYFKSTDGGKTFAPNTITIKPTIQGEISFGKWQYSIDGGVSFADVVSGQKGLTISNNVLTVSKDSSLYSYAVTMVTFRAMASDSSFYDTCSIAKLYDVTDIGDGRNLLWNSNFAKTDEAITTSAYTTWGLVLRGNTYTATIDTSAKHNNFNTLKVIGTKAGENSGQDLIYRIKGLDLNEVKFTTTGTKYTLSFYAKASTACNFSVRYAYDSYTKDTNAALGTDWKRYEIQMHPTTTSYQTALILKMDAASTVWFSEFKLEKGSSATGYSTAPEDVQTAILSTKSEISSVSSKVDQNTKSIQNKVENTTYQNDLKLVKGDISKANEGLNKWRYEIYPKSLFDSKWQGKSTMDVFAKNTNLTPSQSVLINDTDFGKNWAYGDNYIAYALTFVKFSAAKSVAITFKHDDGAHLYLNGKLIGGSDGCNTGSGHNLSLSFVKGWNCLEVVLNEITGGEYIGFGTTISALSECQLMNCYYGTPVARQSHITNQLVQNTTDIEGISGSVQKVMSTVGGSGKIDEFVNNYSTWKKKVDGIETRVGETYTTKDDFNGLEIGGRNLVRLGGLSSNGATSFSYDKTTDTYTIVSPVVSTVWGVGVAVRYDDNHKVLIPYGKTYILSFEVKVPQALSINIDINNYAVSGNSWAGNDNDAGSTRGQSSYSIPANTWTKVWVRWANTNAKNTNKVDLYDFSGIGLVTKDCTSAVTWQIRHVKGELGNKPTDWTPAPEDVNGKIVNVETIANQTAKKFEWIVKGGDSSSNFTLTDRVADLVAERINLNGLVTFSGLNTDAKNEIGKVAQSKVDGLEIGGRNLLVQRNITQGYLSTDGKGSFIGTGGGDQTSDWIDVSGNKYITITLYEDFTNTNNSGRYCEYDADKNCINTVDYNPRSKSSIIIELKTNTKYIRVTAIECKTRRYKIETGNKATDWTPAPEDVSQDATTKANQALTDAKEYAKNSVDWVTNNGQKTQNLYSMVSKWAADAISDTTEINGGLIKSNTILARHIVADAITSDKILAGSVTADKIDVKDLFAQDITASGTIKSKNYAESNGAATAGSKWILSDGSFKSKNLSWDASGNITAAGGKIGKYTITDSYLITGSGATASGFGGNQAFWAGSSSSNDAPFRVGYNGQLVASGATLTNAIVSGDITAIKGQIGELVLQDGTLTGSGQIIKNKTDSSGNITSTTTTDYITKFSKKGLNIESVITSSDSDIKTNCGTSVCPEYIGISNGKLMNWIKPNGLSILGSDTSTISINTLASTFYYSDEGYKTHFGIDHQGISLMCEDGNKTFKINVSGADGMDISGANVRLQNNITASRFVFYKDSFNYIESLEANNTNNIYFHSNGYYSFRVNNEGNWSNETQSVYITERGISVPGEIGLYSQEMSNYVARYYVAGSTKSTAIGNNSYQTRIYGSSVWANKAVSTSDVRLKQDFQSLDKFEDLYMQLQPVSFKYIDGYDKSEDRYFGLKAQPTEKLFEDMGENPDDYAMFNKFGIDHEDIKERIGHDVDFDEEHGLDYTNMIALNTHMVQKTRRELAKLEAENAELKASLKAIIQKLNMQQN